MPSVYVDAAGHEVDLGPLGASNLTAGAVSTSAAGTISPTTSAGASPTVTFITGVACNDRRGRFLLNPVTGGGAQAAGQVCLVRFSKEYPSPPKAVIVTIANQTDTTAAIVASANLVTSLGFDILVGTALTTAKVYVVNYQVVM